MVYTSLRSNNLPDCSYRTQYVKQLLGCLRECCQGSALDDLRVLRNFDLQMSFLPGQLRHELLAILRPFAKLTQEQAKTKKTHRRRPQQQVVIAAPELW
jgi:hypothetical protein